jgi:transcription elongation factor GreB
MNKAFVREDAGDDEEDDVEDVDPAASAGGGPRPPNYITPQGHARLRTELLHLLDTERPQVVSVVSWAASNGDRSENGDYLYGKKRLREIDRRIRFLTRRLDQAVVVDASTQENRDQVFFGATVCYLRNGTSEETITIVGVDEVDPLNRRVSWVSPVARALIKAREGETVSLRTPGGVDELEILEVSYPQASPPAGD